MLTAGAATAGPAITGSVAGAATSAVLGGVAANKPKNANNAAKAATQTPPDAQNAADVAT